MGPYFSIIRSSSDRTIAGHFPVVFTKYLFLVGADWRFTVVAQGCLILDPGKKRVWSKGAFNKNFMSGSSKLPRLYGKLSAFSPDRRKLLGSHLLLICYIIMPIYHVYTIYIYMYIYIIRICRYIRICCTCIYIYMYYVYKYIYVLCIYVYMYYVYIYTHMKHPCNKSNILHLHWCRNRISEPYIQGTAMYWAEFLWEIPRSWLRTWGLTGFLESDPSNLMSDAFVLYVSGQNTCDDLCHIQVFEVQQKWANFQKK